MLQIFLRKACRKFLVKPLNKRNLLAMEDYLDKLFSLKNKQEVFLVPNHNFLGDKLFRFKVYLEHHNKMK
jgi:hypothetical protein